MTTKLLSLACHHCGAPLRVPDDVRYVTCQHCGASLTVEHQGNVAFTRQLDEIGSKVDELHDALLEERREQERAEELAREFAADPRGAFQTVGRVQRMMLPMMALPVAAFFLFVGWQFHPVVGIGMAAIPVLGSLSFFLVSKTITDQMQRTQETVSEGEEETR